jgi:CTP-dependent riboflavin kinase
MILRGTVVSRYGTASENLATVESLILGRSGLSCMARGTLNLQLPAGYLVAPHFVIQPEEYVAGELLKFARCRIRGLDCWIMRPATHEPELADVLEIVSEHRLRDYFRVADGDVLEVELLPG